MSDERSGENGDGIRAAEAREGMTPPASEVDLIQRQVGPTVSRFRVRRQQSLGIDEGSETRGL